MSTEQDRMENETPIEQRDNTSRLVRIAEAAAAESVAYAESLATPPAEPAEIHIENFGEAIAEAEKAAGAPTMDEETRNATNDPASERAAVEGSDSSETAGEASTGADDGYEAEGVTKEDLVKMLEGRGLAKTGSKAELIERLREDDKAKA